MPHSGRCADLGRREREGDEECLRAADSLTVLPCAGLKQPAIRTRDCPGRGERAPDKLRPLWESPRGSPSIALQSADVLPGEDVRLARVRSGPQPSLWRRSQGVPRYWTRLRGPAGSPDPRLRL